jgi:hypothetical protein
MLLTVEFTEALFTKPKKGLSRRSQGEWQTCLPRSHGEGG